MRRAVSSRIEQRRVISAPPQAVYRAFADPKVHTAFTGAKATGRARAGSKFSAWDGYILGRTLVADPGRRLVQEWWTTEWPEGFRPSRLELRFGPHARGTQVILVQTHVPREQVKSYRSGWVEYYWRPLRSYFARPGTRRAAGGSGAK